MFGKGPYEYIEIFKHFGIAKSPRVVVMNLFEGNDFYDALNFHAFREEITRKADPVPFTVNCVLREPFCSVYRFLKESPLGQRSYAYNLIANGARLSLDWVSHRSRAVAGGEPSASFRYRLVANGLTTRFDDPSHPTRYILDHRGEIKAGTFPFSQMAGALKDFVELSRRYGFQPIVSYTPAPYTVYAGRLDFDEASVEDVLATFSHQQRNFVAAEAKALGFTFVDLTPILQARAAGTSKLLYFPSNIHLTPTGHQVVAEALSGQFLLRKALVP